MAAAAAEQAAAEALNTFARAGLSTGASSTRAGASMPSSPRPTACGLVILDTFARAGSVGKGVVNPSRCEYAVLTEADRMLHRMGACGAQHVLWNGVCPPSCATTMSGRHPLGGGSGGAGGASRKQRGAERGAPRPVG